LEVPAELRAACERLAAPDPAAVPADPAAERAFWTARDLAQEGLLAKCEARGDALLRLMD